MKCKQSIALRSVIPLLSAAGLAVTQAQAAIVSPMIGGGQVGIFSAPMKHANILFDGTRVTVDVDETVPTPVLRALSETDSFDPAAPWSVLQNKAYNWQFAWNPGGIFSPPAGTGIWVERLYQDSGLQVYARPPKFWTEPWPNPWPTLFVEDGDRWKWGGTMTHNAYAVLHPTRSTYTATYRVYLGDAVSGDPVAGYGSADVTFTWNATPTAEPAGMALFGSVVLFVLFRRKRSHSL